MDNHNSLIEKRRFVKGKIIIGIDPANDKHQVQIFDKYGMPLGRSFSFPNSYNGYHTILWTRVRRYLADEVDRKPDLVFAVETACDLWQPLVHYLHSNGYQVVLVSPLATYHARVLPGNDFSRTDPKDALVIATNALNGAFTFYDEYTPWIRSLKTISLTYDKLRKDLQMNRNRIVSFMKRYFPEFLDVLNLDTQTARYLLKGYFLPHQFLQMDTKHETEAILRISLNQHGEDTLLLLKDKAKKTIGVQCEDQSEILALRLTLDSWLDQLDMVEGQMDRMAEELIRLASQSPVYHSVKSLKGISEKTSALFVAETRNMDGVQHYKQIQKLAGVNLRLCQSGRYRGQNRLSHIGNSRLRWLLYMMTKETVKYIPEIRVKYLKRQLKKRSYTKNVMACTSNLLQIIMSLVREERKYDPGLHPEIIIQCKQLDAEYKRKKGVKRSVVQYD